VSGGVSGGADGPVGGPDPGRANPGPARIRHTDPDAEPDPGLARARTELAWLRTAIAFAAIGGVILKRDVPAGLAVLVLGGVVWATGQLATGRLAGSAAGILTRPRRLLFISLAVAAVAVLALAVSLLGRPSAGLRL
jgi:uncharacterized membrane protein YidH (DUF202 family)